MIETLGLVAAVFELFPKERRLVLEKRLVKAVGLSAVLKISIIAVVAYVLLFTFAFVAPYLTMLSVTVLLILLRLGADLAMIDEPLISFFKTLLYVPILIGGIVLWYLGWPGLLVLFWASLAASVTTVVAWIIRKEDDFLMAQAVYITGIFLLIGMPSGIGHRFGSSALGQLFSFYEWLSYISHTTVLDVLIPDITAKAFKAMYFESLGTLKSLLPDIVAAWPPIAAYFVASDGYLLLSAIAAQLLFAYFLYSFSKSLIFAILHLILRSSEALKQKFRSQHMTLIPIAGILLVVLGETLEFILSVISRLL